MLKEQEEAWGFQEWVVPHHRPQDNAYRPLTVMQMTHQLKQVKDVAGLPDELQVGDLRKTAIIEMILGGAEALAIQSATGHKNVASLNPYNKFTLETAKAALDMRQRQ
jgi:site-specific recombinase XerD